MGVRGELFSTKVMLQNRTYFFNVKENRLGDIYLNIVESKNREEGGFERQSVILFAEDLQQFLQGFDESLKVLEKATREKRRSKNSDAPTGFRQNRNAHNGDRDFDSSRNEEPRRYKKRERPMESREHNSRYEPRERAPRRESREHGPRYEQREYSPRHESREQGSRYEPKEYGPRHESRDHNQPHERKRKDAPRKKRVVVKKR